MPKIVLETNITSDIVTVFNLSRSVALHELSTSKTNEKAVDGVTNGLLGLGDVVTWRARHLGVYQYLTVEISKFKAPYFFEDRMVKGVFKSMNHQHYFYMKENRVCMNDIFEYKAPLGILGKLADVLFLERYMHRFLEKRNKVIKEIAEDPKKVTQFLKPN
ncbi:hypothetical protein NBRC110019_01150 [Neptunitalea chrysea]|uniref:Cell division protein n=1 Tax=Neptunitalea chrysea TaxID=1647581 RepID=A0A9W6B2F0_9FLAO|nr:SRPBCC family protein [Neptunitalea chrysea]GLB51076.1 hypothetical protein NBRC110019_01150 [Neptunitalea chrysea]